MAFAIGIGTLAVILFLQNRKWLPGILIAVVGATAIVAMLDLTRYDVAVLGPLPSGLPSFLIPRITISDFTPVLIRGVKSPVSFADTSVLSRAYAARIGTHVDPNQEMAGLGAANLATGFFQGSRSAAAVRVLPWREAAGARTQLTSVVGALSSPSFWWWRQTSFNICRPLHWPPLSSRPRSAWSRSPTSSGSIASSNGSFGYQSSASPA